MPHYTGVTVVRGVATLPQPPQAYALPSSYTAVGNSADLITALQSGVATNIVVEDGTYTKTTGTGEVDCGAAHKVYGRNLGGALIQFGIASNKSGHVFQGLALDVTDTTLCLNGIQLHLWGNSAGAQILDTTFLGDNTIIAGVGTRSNNSYEGFVLRRCEARNFNGYGFLVDSNDTSYVPTIPPIVEDIYGENCVFKTNAQIESNGQAEAAVWAGTTGTYRRIHAHVADGYITGGRGQAWYGFWGGTRLYDSLVEDVYVDGQIAFGVYLEHTSHNCVFNRMQTALPVNVGFHCEWTHPEDPVPTNKDHLVQDSWFDSTCAGVHLDEGTETTTVRRSVFRYQASAAIDNYANAGRGNLYDLGGNDYTMIGGGAVSISTANGGAFPCWNNA